MKPRILLLAVLVLLAVSIGLGFLFFGKKTDRGQEVTQPTINVLSGPASVGKISFKNGIGLTAKGVGQPFVITGQGNVDGMTAKLQWVHPFERTTKPVCDLAVKAGSSSTFQIEVPTGKLDPGNVYKLVLENTSGKIAYTYQIEVGNK